LNPAGAENRDGSRGAEEKPLDSVVISINEPEAEAFSDGGGVELAWESSWGFFFLPKPPKPPNFPPNTLPRSGLGWGLDCCEDV
jgi:hypothetical protein